MRNIFGKNVTDDKNPVYDGEAAFLRQRVPAEQQAVLEEQADRLTASVKKMVCLPLVIVQVVAVIVGFICLRVFLNLWTDEDVLLWWLLAVAVVCFAAFAVLLWGNKKRRESVEQSDDYQTLTTQMEAASMGSRALLGIPADAADIEVLGYDYEMKNGKEKRTDSNWEYDTCCFYAFAQEGELFLADNVNKFAISLAAVTAVRRRMGKTKVFMWLKDEEPKSAAYKPYKVKYDEDRNVYTLPAVVVLEIAHGEATYQLVLPEYEWERVLQPLVGGAVPALTEE
ncbi:MAG: hypothetical protein IJO76_03805 [Clostridia bacterium]|nr:hypothetical protein [Clostridia bacterium]